MKFKRSGSQKKILITIATLLLLLGSTLIPLFNIITDTTVIKEESLRIILQDNHSEQNAVGDPVGDPAIQNINTSEVFSSIQGAINDSDTVNGNILEVNSSTYTENVIITKSLTIHGIGTGENQPLLDGGGGIGCVIAVNNVTIDNMNISNSSIGIFSNYSGVTVSNSTFWFDSHGIDLNYTKTCDSDTNYQLYDNSIQNNRFLIDTANDYDGAIIINIALNYQNHSGAVIIGDITVMDNHFLLNDSHAYAVLYKENSIRWLNEGSVSIGSFIFSDNTLYKNNNGNNGVYFIGSLTHLNNDSVSVDDIIVSFNTVFDQTNAAFYLEQYMAEYWSGTTTGIYGEILVTNNTISSSVSSDGIQISQTNICDFQDDASLSIGDCHIEGNNVIVSEGYAIVFYMDNIGYQLQDNASVLVGQVSISSNVLSAGNGLLVDYYQCGDTLSQDSSCTLGALQIVNNIIDSTENGIHIQQFSYLGFELYDDAVFCLADIHLDNNQVESGSHGIYFSQLLLGENLSGSSVCSFGNLTLDDNDISSSGDGILFTDNVSSFRLGNSMGGNSVVSFQDIQVSHNTISDSASGVFIGPLSVRGRKQQP